MNPQHLLRTGIEPLESRIAPAGVIPTIKAAEAAYDANPLDNRFVLANHGEGDPILVKAGQVLSTGNAARDGTYLLTVEKGQMLVFLTDLNNNQQVDFNEITGIAAGDGLRFTSFVDIHGDIVTNLDADGTLSDSDNNSTNDPDNLKGDGLVLNNSRIESITLRSLTIADVTDQNQDNVIDDADVGLRLALSSYSIHGQVLAGKGFGVVGDKSSGLLIDATGFDAQEEKFNGVGLTYFIDGAKASVGAIRTGTAANGEYFAFGVSRNDDTDGVLRTFSPPAAQNGGDIYNIRSAVGTTFNLSGLFAGNGGINGRGGNIDTVTLNGDTASGYKIVAGDGGSGPTGGGGGSILGFTDLGSTTGQVLLDVGSGGTGSTGAGGNGGTLGLGTVPRVDVDGNPIPAASGQAPLNNININAGLEITLGDGGNGFTAGGNGASLTKAVINTPEGAVEYGRAVVATTHDGKHNPLTGRLVDYDEVAGRVIRDSAHLGTIGRQNAVDIDGDGFTDVVFTSSEPEQLVVQFGNGLGGFRTDPVTGRPVRIYLDGPSGAEGLAVGDFNGDGHQDIVAASSDVGNFAGIMVFLSKWEDANLNGLASQEDLNKNGKDDFLGFYSSRTSPLPSLASGGSTGSATLDSVYRYTRSANAINDIVVGDFNGDGFTEIAVAATYLTIGTDLSPQQNQVVVVLSPDIEEVENTGTFRQTGHFFADVGFGRVGDEGANPLVPFYELQGGGSLFSGGGTGNSARIEATPLSTSAGYDVIIGEAVAGLNEVNGTTSTRVVNGVAVLNFSTPSIFGPVVSRFSYEFVDTARALNATSLSTVYMRDFTVVDFNNDGKTDVVMISEEPEGFLVAVQGNGLGGGFVVTKNPLTTNNQGFFFGGNDTNKRAIRATEVYSPFGDFADANGATSMDDVVVLDYSFGRTLPDPDANFSLEEISIWNFSAQLPASVVANPGVDLIQFLENGLVRPSGADNEVVGFDRFAPTVTTALAFNYATATPTKSASANHAIDSYGLKYDPGTQQFSVNGPFQTPLAEHFVRISAGDGGNGVIGKGGAGGFLGGAIRPLSTTDELGVVSTDLFGSLNITLPKNSAFSGVVVLNGGNGGNGFTTGGLGGGIGGARVGYALGTTNFHSEVLLFGGDGGFGISGAGGAGGDLRANSLVNGVWQEAGDGGRGKIGGAGGSIVGHGNLKFPDNREAFQQIFAGDGGSGVIRGGAGGSILNYHGQFNLAVAGGDEGIINYIAGHGGGAVSGPGGNGGDVINTSPFTGGTGVNSLSGDIYLRGGDGGNGLSGGRGGDVTRFRNSASQDVSPAVLSMLGGEGGNGTRGAGGRGGDVRDITVSSTGTPSDGAAPLVDGRPVSTNGSAQSTRATVYDFNRIMAGDGGTSAGGAGGAGGTVANIISGSVGNAFAVVAGAGGEGLLAGGRGGSVLTARLDVGSKALVIAGAGGDATAFIANAGDPAPNQAEKAFGGRVGRGGDGGDIRNFVQLGGVGARVDLIAGNGGDTVNYGRVDDAVNNVGRGGSVVGVKLGGNAGNIDSLVAIKSYNDLNAGQTVADFVTLALRSNSTGGDIGDTVGNVGIVVGAAGRLKSLFAGFDENNQPIFQSLPGFKGGNGDLIDISAGSIMSAVAGSVERIAAIRTARGLNVVASGEVGTDKSVVIPNYLDKFGNVIPEPASDGFLIDGALVTGTSVPSVPAGNHFVLP